MGGPCHSFVMAMEKISSRKNTYIRHVRELAVNGAYRAGRGEYLCDGVKTLKEALRFGAAVRSVLWKDRAGEVPGLSGAEQYLAPAALFDYASPMKNSPGPLFTVKIPAADPAAPIANALVLESVQDPGNVGTVIRTANAFGLSAVILTGDCADLYNPKTVRASMGAIFRQRVLHVPREELPALLEKNSLPLYGAPLFPPVHRQRGGGGGGNHVGNGPIEERGMKRWPRLNTGSGSPAPESAPGRRHACWRSTAARRRLFSLRRGIMPA